MASDDEAVELHGLATESLDSPSTRSRRASSVLEKLHGEEEEPTKVRVGDLLAIMALRVKRKRLVRDFGIYAVFIVLYILQLTMLRNVTDTHRMEQALVSNIIEDEFEGVQYAKTFADISKIDDFWQWVEGPLVGALTVNTDAAGNPLPADRLRYVANVNRIVGAVRFRQLRVNLTDCPNRLMRPLYPKCVPRYDPARNKVANGTLFGPYRFLETRRGTPTHTPTEVSHISANRFYPGDGFIADLYLQKGRIRTPCDGENTTEAFVSCQVAAMKANGFVDRQTSVVFVTFSAYNGHLDMFIQVQVMVETDDAGRLRPSYNFRPFRPGLYHLADDWGRLVVEIFVLLFIGFFIYSEVSEILDLHRKGRLALYFTAWNAVDVLNLAFFLVIIVWQIAYAGRPVPPKLGDPSLQEYPSLDGWARDFVSIVNFTSFNVFLSFLKIFKFLEVSARMSLIWRTLSVASTDLLAFSIFFFIVFLGFATMGHIQFGGAMDEFDTFWGSVTTCFNMALGDFNLDAMSRANRVLGPLFYVLFVVLVFFILVNMFLAIINDAYQEAHKHLSRFDLTTQAARAWRNLVRVARMRKQERMDSSVDDEQLLDKLDSIPGLHHAKNTELTEEQLSMRLDTHISADEVQRLLRLYRVLHDHEGYKEPLQRARKIDEREERRRRKAMRARRGVSVTGLESDPSERGEAEEDPWDSLSEDEEDVDETREMLTAILETQDAMQTQLDRILAAQEL